MTVVSYIGYRIRKAFTLFSRTVFECRYPDNACSSDSIVSHTVETSCEAQFPLVSSMASMEGKGEHP